MATAAEDPSKPEVRLSKGPRYNYRFCAAFSVPLKSEKRFLSLTDFSFSDSQPSVGDYVEIEAKYIAPEHQVGNRDDLIAKNVEAWIAERNLTREQFLARASPPCQ